MTATYKIHPMICVDSKGYVIALVDWRGDVRIRRNRLSGSDMPRLVLWWNKLPGQKIHMTLDDLEDALCQPATP